MTGLEKILKAIEEDASANVDAGISKAKREAEEIMETAKKEAEKKCNEIAVKSDMDVKAVLSRAESSASLLEKKIILDAKQQRISNVIINARNSLMNLQDKEYADVLIQMVHKHAHNKQGKILFSAVDKNRLPKDFETMLQKALVEKAGANLSVSEETANIDGGFILKYGDVEENCSFDALFSAAKEELQDKVNTILFSSIAEDSRIASNL